MREYDHAMSAGNGSNNEKQRGGRIPFALLLPLLSILSCVCFVAVPVTVDQLQLSPPHKAGQRIPQDLPGQKAPHIALWLNGIDLPANFVELPIDRLAPTWPETWYPNGFTVFSWRAVTFPFYSLPFWWFAGLGLDALFRTRHLAWPVLLLGSALCLLFVLMAYALTQQSERSFDAPGVHLPIVVGAYLWAILFWTFPAAWFLHRGSPAPADRGSPLMNS